MSKNHQILPLLRRSGDQRASTICASLHISQPVFSRAARELIQQEKVLALGERRNRRYAALRHVDFAPAGIPVFEILPENNRSRHLGKLYPVCPQGFAFCYQDVRGRSAYGVYPDLPWFLDNFRPAGFLGRLVPASMPEGSVPADIRDWDAEHVLRFALALGYDVPGALLLGDRAFELWQQSSEKSAGLVRKHDCPACFDKMARDIMQKGTPGSSAGGEQLKFLTTRRGKSERQAVIVKFSPLLKDGGTAAQRTADLLIAEHIGHHVLREFGLNTVRSCLHQSTQRVYLEIDRFDRHVQGRSGQISLQVLDAQFAGSAERSWPGASADLVRAGIIDKSCLRTVRWLHLFGQLIANSDMHFGNLSFEMDGLKVGGLTPVYDMLPMAYAPRGGEVVPWQFAPQPVAASNGDIAQNVLAAARKFWQELAVHPQISYDFATICRDNDAQLSRLEILAKSLPQ